MTGMLDPVSQGKDSKNITLELYTAVKIGYSLFGLHLDALWLTAAEVWGIREHSQSRAWQGLYLGRIRCQPPKDFCFFCWKPADLRIIAIQNKEWGSWILVYLSLKLSTAWSSNSEDALNPHPTGRVLVPCPVLYGDQNVQGKQLPLFSVKRATAIIVLEFMLFMPNPWPETWAWHKYPGTASLVQPCREGLQV